MADTAGVVEQELALGEAAGYATVQPIGAVTVGQKGERLAELGAMASSRARVRVFSDDGFCVFDPLIMRRALELTASALILVHNHPSGDPTPSQADITMTNRIVAAAEVMGLTVHDHLIIGKSRELSFRSEGLL